MVLGVVAYTVSFGQDAGINVVVFLNIGTYTKEGSFDAFGFNTSSTQGVTSGIGPSSKVR
ncbi:MAG: hypothetical protein U0V54_10110 [Saprospiraceae bacterium]